MSVTGKKITRQMLYTAVWSQSIKSLAQEWDTTYARIVEAWNVMRVPRPGQEYWPRLAIGYQVEQSPLPEDEVLTELELLPPGTRSKKKKMLPEANSSSAMQEPPSAAAVSKAGMSERNSIGQVAETAVLDVIRQNPQIDFWQGILSEKVYLHDLRRWLKLPKNIEAPETAMKEAIRKVQKEYRTFKIEISESPNSASWRRDGYLCIAAVLGDEYEWDDAVSEAWTFVENPNPYCLTDNSLKLYLWAKSPKNQGALMETNKIGAQAGLRGSYRHIDKSGSAMFVMGNKLGHLA
jgi:hypothetical protein